MVDSPDRFVGMMPDEREVLRWREDILETVREFSEGADAPIELSDTFNEVRRFKEGEASLDLVFRTEGDKKTGIPHAAVYILPPNTTFTDFFRKEPKSREELEYWSRDLPHFLSDRDRTQILLDVRDQLNVYLDKAKSLQRA